MKNFLLLLALLTLTGVLLGQNTEIEKIDSLLNDIKIQQSELTEEIKVLQKNEDSLLKAKQLFIESKYFGETFICFKSTYCYPTPQKDFVNGYIIKKSEKVKVLERIGEFYKIMYKGNVGYVSPLFLRSEVETVSEEKTKDSINAVKAAEKKLKEEQLQKERLKVLTDKYGAISANKIIARRIWLGMTSEMAIESWGKPNDVNRTVTSYRIDEQWVYGDISNSTYLYFEDGKLVSWQD